MKVFLTNFHYKKDYSSFRDYALAGALYSLLAIPTICYYTISKTRNFLYKKGLIKTFQSRVYTISVGNLTTGGTGKTPITAQIANYLFNRGERPVILSRGYGGTLSNKEVNIVSDGKIINFTAKEAGDEPFWLAEHCKGTGVLTCSSRIKAAKLAQSKLRATRLILDDGYQHQKLKRDLNILVVDCEKQFSNGFVLPMGALREPLSEIKRADKIIVVNKSFNEKRGKTYARFLQKTYKKPAFVCSMVPDSVYNIKTGELIKDNLPVTAFCAIGQPEQFYGFLRGYDVLGTMSYPDHHLYTKEDINELLDLKQKYGAQAIITTEKDAVKIKDLLNDDCEIYALKLAPVLDLKSILDE